MYSIEGERVHNINGVEVVSILGFAKLIHRSETTIRKMISIGNKYRILKTVYLDSKPFIPVNELFDYPFTLQGRSKNIAFHFELQGTELTIVHADGYCKTERTVMCNRECATCLRYTKFKKVKTDE